jgi:transposase
MTRRHGWTWRGQPLHGKAPHGRWTTMTFLAALRHDRIAAPCLLDGPINGTSFLAWIQQFLLPTLNSGDIVVMDNLGSHKAIAGRHALRAVGANPRASGLGAAGLRECIRQYRVPGTKDAASWRHRTD